jgi:hypothetical protein
LLAAAAVDHLVAAAALVDIEPEVYRLLQDLHTPLQLALAALAVLLDQAMAVSAAILFSAP